MVSKLETKAEFDAAIKGNNLVAIDFTATWCGPCKQIGPKFEKLQGEFSSIKFYKVDVDENSETAEACGVSAMPTFMFYKNGEKVDELVGASEASLKDKLQKLAA